MNRRSFMKLFGAMTAGAAVPLPVFAGVPGVPGSPLAAPLVTDGAVGLSRVAEIPTGAMLRVYSGVIGAADSTLLFEMDVEDVVIHDFELAEDRI